MSDNPTVFMAFKHMRGKHMERTPQRKEGRKNEGKNDRRKNKWGRTCFSKSACDDGRGFPQQSTVERRIWRRDLSLFCAVMEHGQRVMWRFRKPRNSTAVFVAAAFFYSLYTLNNCRTCIFEPNIRTANPPDFYEEIEGQADFHATSTSSNGFFSPTTLHTIKVEDTDGEIKCMRACSLGLQQTCSELGQRECPAVLRTPARSVVPFEDLRRGDYILRVICADPEKSCSADPQEYSFSVEEQEQTESDSELKHIPLVTIKLLRKFTGQCSREQVLRSRVACLGTLYTLMGICLLLFSHTERLDDAQLPPRSADDLRWLLQSRARS